MTVLNDFVYNREYQQKKKQDEIKRNQMRRVLEELKEYHESIEVADKLTNVERKATYEYDVDKLKSFFPVEEYGLNTILSTEEKNRFILNFGISNVPNTEYALRKFENYYGVKNNLEFDELVQAAEKCLSMEIEHRKLNLKISEFNLEISQHNYSEPKYISNTIMLTYDDLILSKDEFLKIKDEYIPLIHEIHKDIIEQLFRYIA